MNKIKFNTVAEFKRLATKGRYIKGGYYGKHQDEWREIIAVQSNGVSLKTDTTSGRSFMDFPKAGNCKIEDGVMKIYEQRAKCEQAGVDTLADMGWLKWDIERGKIKEEDITYYERQVAEYELGEEC